MSKRLLYIGTPIFNFYQHIISEFEQRGFIVDYYNDRPSESSWIKGIIKMKKNLVKKIIMRYFENLIEETKKEKYDIVLIVNGKIFTNEMIQILKETQPEAEFIYYAWDSLNLYPEARTIINFFDRAYTFDLVDSREILGLELLPLFYSKGFRSINAQQNEYEYDLMSVCTAHPNRYKVISKVFPELSAENYNIFSVLYINKLQFIYNKLFVLEFEKAKASDFSFKMISEKENLAILRKSKAVFDVEHNKQSGLTMRTIETLGAKRKLITTNKTIEKYDFYNENNIFVYEGDLVALKKFLEIKYEEIPEEIYKKYAVSNWVDTLIKGVSLNYLVDD